MPAAGEEPVVVVGYDHGIHDGYVEVKGGQAPGCTDCHTLDKKLRPQQPGHAACFGSGCHVMPRAAAAGPAPGLCAACHDAPRPRKGARAVWAGEPSRDFGLEFPHDRHAQPSRDGGRTGCRECHRAPAAGTAFRPHAARAPAARAPATRAPAARAPTARAPAARAPAAAHDRCVGCHAGAPAKGDPGAPFSIRDCARCHRAIAGRFVSPTQVVSPYAIGATFSHDAHLARLDGPPATRCLACHAEVERTAGAQIPAPAMAGCESCHDGRQAFAALGDDCTTCHARGDAPPSPAPARRFDHRQHVAAGAPATCTSCHRLDAAGAPRPIGHAACADAACHAGEFRARAPTICGGCHVGSEPWRPLRADVGRRTRSEFGAEFSHGAHLGGASPRSTAACSACHTGIRGGPEMRLGPGHAACAGAGCHASAPDAPSPAPALSACTACHQLGLLPARDARRAQSRWSTAARFVHAAHERDVQAQPVDCATCHTGVLTARRVAEIPVPRKPTCGGCHDGILAFKMTGHACSRCHAHERSTAPAPAGP